MEHKERWDKKEKAINTLANNISRLRQNITRDLKSDNERTRIVACIIAIMDRTAERIGNRDSEKEGHFGITGLKKKHINIEGNTVKLNYTGKSAVEQSKQFSDAVIAQTLKEIIKNSPTDDVFTTKSGVRVYRDAVNNRLKDFGITSKDIRGYASNNLVIRKLNEVEKPKTDKERIKLFNQIIKKVAEKIGHTTATLKKHYLLPSLQQKYIEKSKVIDIKMKQGGEIILGYGNEYLNIIFNIN